MLGDDWDLEKVLAGLASLPAMTGSMTDLIYAVGDVRGKDIVISDLPPWLQTAEVCGAWWPGKEQDYFFVAPDITDSYRDHCLGHELGHLWLEHPLKNLAQELSLPTSPGEALTILGRTRTTFSDPLEREAEEFALRLIAPTRGRSANARRLHDRQAARATAVFGGRR